MLLATYQPTARTALQRDFDATLECLTAMQQWMVPLGPPIGTGGGPNTAPNVDLIHGCATLIPKVAANYCWALPPRLKLDSLGKASRLLHNPLKKPCITWHKYSCWRDTLTLPCQAPADHNQALPFTHLLKSFCDQDPAPQLPVARPLSTQLT
jgi:hypothetical protein